MIVIIDFGMGNVKSIMNMLSHVGHQSIISSDKEQILQAEKLILPGVGAFDAAIQHLQERDLISPLNKAVLEHKTPVLGICLGLQIMAKNSEEGKQKGLGWFDADVKHFNFSDNTAIDIKKHPIPHMGWNQVQAKEDCPLFHQLPKNNRFYFVHSYHIECNNKNDAIGLTEYGYEFTCAIASKNIYAVQFHPEKSHKFGMQILKNFAEKC